MKCYICKGEAIDRCYTCGQLFCEQHGKINCSRCEHGFAPGDRRDDHVSIDRLRPPGRAGWWRPQEAEDFEPASCTECGALAQRRCPNCGNRFCPEHVGKKGLCAGCQRARRGSNVCLIIMVLFLAGLTVLGLAYR